MHLIKYIQKYKAPINSYKFRHQGAIIRELFCQKEYKASTLADQMTHLSLYLSHYPSINGPEVCSVCYVIQLLHTEQLLLFTRSSLHTGSMPLFF